MSPASRGLVLAFVGVAIFSLTLPMTRIAVGQIDATWVALARGVIAALLAGSMLLLNRQPLPARAHWRAIMLTALGVVLGFPLFTSLAMQSMPAFHGAVIVGLLPLATAALTAVRGHERPSLRFWVLAGLGSVLVIGYALVRGNGALSLADSWMLLAVILGALGYSEGGRLARVLGGWQTIAWALVFAAPWLLLPTLWVTWRTPPRADAIGWLAFGYVTVLSQFIGFLFWYRGMALAGVARASQVQLLQLFLTVLFSSWLLRETIDLWTWLVGGAVVLTLLAVRRAPIHSANPTAAATVAASVATPGSPARSLTTPP